MPRGVQADAPTYRVAVLELSVADVGDALARNLIERVRATIGAEARFELHDSRVSLEQLSLAHDCDATQPVCLDRIARGLGVDGLVFGKLTNEHGAAVAKLEHYDVDSRAVTASALATVALNEADVVAVEHKAQELVADLFQLGAARSPFSRGSLTPKASLLDRSLTQSSSIDARKVTGYALLGGAVLSAGMSVLSFAEIDHAENNSAFERYRRAVGQMRPTVRDVCDEASGGASYGLDSASFQRVKSSCSTGRTFEVLQFIFIGSAVLSSGVSAYLLFGSDGKERPPLGSVGNGQFSFHPAVQRTGGSLGVRLRF